MACLLTWLEVEGRLYYRGQSDFTIARSARRRASTGAVVSPTRKAKVLHQVNSVIAQSKIRRRPVDRFTRYFDLRQGPCRRSVARIVAGSCACAASDHAAAAPPMSVMNSRLFIRSPRQLPSSVLNPREEERRRATSLYSGLPVWERRHERHHPARQHC
jgi:hypothetical protein